MMRKLDLNPVDRILNKLLHRVYKPAEYAFVRRYRLPD